MAGMPLSTLYNPRHIMPHCVDVMNDVLKVTREPDTKLHEDSIDLLQEHGVYVLRNVATDGGNAILIDKEHHRKALPTRQAIFDSLVAKMNLTADEKQRLRWAFEAVDYSPYAPESSSAAQGSGENVAQQDVSHPRPRRIVDVGSAAWLKARENKPFGFYPPADAEDAVGRMDFQLEMDHPGYFHQKYCFDKRDILLFNEYQAFCGEAIWRPLMRDSSGLRMAFKLTSTDLPHVMESEAIAVNMTDFLTDKRYSDWSLPEVMAGEGVLAPGVDDGFDTDEMSDLEEYLGQGAYAVTADLFPDRWGTRWTKRFGFLRDLNENNTLYVYWTKDPLKLTTFLPDDPVVLNLGGEPILVDVDDKTRLAEVMSLERNDAGIENLIFDEQADQRLTHFGRSEWQPMCLACERRKWEHYERLVQKLWCLLWSHEITDEEEWVAIFGPRDQRHRALPLANEWVQKKLRQCPVIKGCFCFKIEYEASPGWYH
jgi:hypothetical protein